MEHERIVATLTAHEYQIGRLVSDAESEKETRARINSEILHQVNELRAQVRELEHAYWKACGAMGAILVAGHVVGFVILKLLK